MIGVLLTLPVRSHETGHCDLLILLSRSRPTTLSITKISSATAAFLFNLLEVYDFVDFIIFIIREQ
jgi:hypothetical protein